MNITTKFNLGDTVYFAFVDKVTKSTPCTACGGNKMLEVVPITGKPYMVDCRDCSGTGRNDFIDLAPGARKLTLGQVTVCVVNSLGLDGEDTFDNYKPQSSYGERYMAVETGIGSGSVYNGEDLFSFEYEALDQAKIKVEKARVVIAEQAEQQRKWIASKYKD
jgi:hypothetical protein